MNKLEIVVDRIDDNHLDSFWYDGVIARAGEYELVANGDIRVNQENKDGDYIGMFDGKARDGFVEPENDQELQKLYADEDGYRMINNNWFEVIDKHGNTVGDICDDYDGGIEWLKEISEGVI